MASAAGSPVQKQEQRREPAPPDSASETALVPAASGGAEEQIILKAPVSRLPVELEVGVPIREFRVRHLVGLSQGQVIATQWIHSDDVPLAARGVQLAWTEFEVVDSRLAVRITRLA
jgi:flagellar motor switch protein FliM